MGLNGKNRVSQNIWHGELINLSRSNFLITKILSSLIQLFKKFQYFISKNCSKPAAFWWCRLTTGLNEKNGGCCLKKYRKRKRRKNKSDKKRWMNSQSDYVAHDVVVGFFELAAEPLVADVVEDAALAEAFVGVAQQLHFALHRRRRRDAVRRRALPAVAVLQVELADLQCRCPMIASVGSSLVFGNFVEDKPFAMSRFDHAAVVLATVHERSLCKDSCSKRNYSLLSNGVMSWKCELRQILLFGRLPEVS